MLVTSVTRQQTKISSICHETDKTADYGVFTTGTGKRETKMTFMHSRKMQVERAINLDDFDL
jgi:hypothetical protein